MRAVFLILLLSPSFIYAQLRSGQPCRNPKGQQGTCVPLRQCQPLWNIYLSRDRSKNSLLRQAHCGFEVRDPLVCCESALASQIAVDKPAPLSGGGRSIGVTAKPSKTTARPTTQKAIIPAKMVKHPAEKLLPSTCGYASHPYIVGGTKAQLGEHPWLVGLQYLTYKGPFVGCGGVLISSRYVLTAAHCIRNNANERLTSVLLGEHNLSTDPDCEKTREGQICAPPVQKISIQESVKHPQYSSGTSQHNDIALIRLEKNVVLSEYVAAVCLPSGENRARSLAGSLQTVAGWGRTEDYWKSDEKLTVTVPLLENSKCSELYASKGVNLAETQVCAGGQAGKDSCSGDSGGPLLLPEIHDGEQAAWVVTGIVSIGPDKCGTANQPGIYTRVAPYLPWIMDNLKP